MANYATANKATLQAKLIGAFQSGELRHKTPKSFLKLIGAGPIMFPDYKAILDREDHTLQANYAAVQARSLGSARSHAHTGNVGSSAIITPSWTTYTDVFKYSLKQGDKNLYSLDEMIMAEMQSVVGNFANSLEAAVAAYLFAHRSTANDATVEGTFNATQYAFEIQEKDADRAIQITTMVMDINKYGGKYNIFCDSVAYNKFQYLAAQGAGNSDNLSFQFAGVEFIHVVDMYALAAALGTPYTRGFWVCVPEGMVAALPWIPKQNREGKVTTVGSYSSIINPVDGLPYALHEYETAADGTSTGGYTQDVYTQVEVSIDVALEHAPLTTGAPLQAFSIVPTIVG